MQVDQYLWLILNVISCFAATIMHAISSFVMISFCFNAIGHRDFPNRVTICQGDEEILLYIYQVLYDTKMKSITQFPLLDIYFLNGGIC